MRRAVHPFHDELLARLRVVDGHADVVGLFADARVLRRIADVLAEPFAEAGVEKVAGTEARGFVLGTAVALALDAGFVAVRKPGRFIPARRRAP